MPRIITIERKHPSKGTPAVPFQSSRGYKMADPENGAARHHAKHAIFVETLEGVADGLLRGWLLWMKQPGKRETLIVSANLEVRYA